MVSHPHIPQEEFAFLDKVNVLALDFYGVKLLQKAMDSTISAEELALLKRLVVEHPVPA